MRTKILLAALAASAFATPAMAQTLVVADGEPKARGVVLLPLTLTKHDDVNFGTVLASPLAGGTVTVPADGGARTFGGAGGVTGVASDSGHRGLFEGTGDAGETVILDLTPPAGMVLGGPGSATIAITSFELDSAGADGDPRIIPASGTFTVGVGGTFAIAAGQANGVYSADFILTAQYP